MIAGPAGLSVAAECRPTGIACSTYYAVPAPRAGEAELLTATIDSDHDRPVFPDRAKELVADGPDQLRVADVTYVAITGGFVYVAIMLDA